MEWIEALSKEQLRSILHEAALTDSEISSKIRSIAREPISIDKFSFLIVGREQGLPKGIPLCLNKRKAQRWIDNCDKYILSNSVLILQAITEAVIDCILHQQRPDADLFAFLCSLYFLYCLLFAW